MALGDLMTHAHFQDQAPNGSNGGTSVVGWNIRRLDTTIENNIVGCSLASNQVTLAAGTYLFRAIGAGNGGARHKIAIYNVTDAVYEILGSCDYTAYGGAYKVRGLVTIASEKVFEVRQRYGSGRSGSGFGDHCTTGDVEKFVDLMIWKRD